MPPGGKRPGAGRPKGTTGIPLASTISKQQARDALREAVIREMSEMIEAQVKHAKGLSYLVARHKTSGKFEKLTADEAELLLSGEESERVVIEVWEKDPSVQAFTDLMNRALDKPAEQEQTLNITGSIDVVTVLRERHAKRLQSSQPLQLSE